MGQRAASLAEQFEQANSELIALVEGLSDEQWRAISPAEGWPVGVVAHHVANSHRGIAERVRALAVGQPPAPRPMEVVHQANAEHAEQYANVGQAETLELLRRNGQAVAQLIRGLDDEALDRGAEFRGAHWTAGEMIERTQIGHVRGHLDNIRSAVG